MALAASLLLLGACARSSTTPETVPTMAPDATEPGKVAVSSGEFYKFGAYCDDRVLPCSGSPPALPDSQRFIELWAQVFRPATLDATSYPLVVMLHGNHGTCGTPATDLDRQWFGMPPGSSFHVDMGWQYTLDGTCADGESVVRSHLGYAYLAERLAGNGYVVVSINANRGITAGEGLEGDEALIFARARLVLSHLELLSAWNRGDASRMPPNPEGKGLPQALQGRIDFSKVGFFGHSRGGEGVRSAYALYRDGDPTPGAPDWRARIPGMTVRGVFEVGPTDYGRDGLSGPPLAPAGPVDAQGTAWTVLLPMCDGDVSDLADEPQLLQHRVAVLRFRRMHRPGQCLPVPARDRLARAGGCGAIGGRRLLPSSPRDRDCGWIPPGGGPELRPGIPPAGNRDRSRPGPTSSSGPGRPGFLQFTC
jgi:hypothetical protein